MSDDDVLFVKSDIWQAADGFDWTLSVAEWGESASGHSEDPVGAYRAIDKVMAAWAAKHIEAGEEGEPLKLLAIRMHTDSRNGMSN